MMSTEDIKDLLYRKLKEVYYGIPVYKDRHPPYKKGQGSGKDCCPHGDDVQYALEHGIR